RCLVAHLQVKHAEFFVDAEHGPHIWRVAGVGLAFNNRGGVFRIAAVPVPHQATGVHVERADHAAWLIGGDVVGDVTANDYQVPGHRRWRGGVVAARGEGADVGAQVDLTLVAEVFAHLAGVGVQGDQTRVGGRQEYAPRAHVGDNRSDWNGSSRCSWLPGRWLGRWLGRDFLSGSGGVGSVIVVVHATAGH